MNLALAPLGGRKPFRHTCSGRSENRTDGPSPRLCLTRLISSKNLRATFIVVTVTTCYGMKRMERYTFFFSFVLCTHTKYIKLYLIVSFHQGHFEIPRKV